MSRKTSVPGGEGAPPGTPPAPGNTNSLLATPTSSANTIPKSPKPPTPTGQNTKPGTTQPPTPAKGQTPSQPIPTSLAKTKDKTSQGKTSNPSGQQVILFKE